ncbi:MAG: glycosyltransferase family protein [Pseudidiomarina maritima]|nr:glycosyltransferase family protein [Pseudidiomarina maritima]
MRILVGVQGTGNGHLSRCAALAEAASQRSDIELDFLVSGRPQAALFDMEAFGDWQWREGLTFAVQQGRVSLRETMRRNNWGKFWQDVQQLDLAPYDLIVSDYEPITAWAGRKQQRRVIGIGRQFAFYKATQTLPIHVAQRQLLRWFAPVSEALGMHWFEDGQHTVPPIIHQRAQVTNLQQRHYLVYLPFENLAAIHQLLAPLSDYRFSVFHPQAEHQQVGHVHYYPPSRQGFADCFASVAGVISNAGFETSCEALAMGKKLLVRPLQGQFEQVANARCLDIAGLAQVMEELSTEQVQRFIEQDSAVYCKWPNVAEAVVAWLAAGAQEPLAKLSKRLWQQSELHDYFQLVKRN